MQNDESNTLFTDNRAEEQQAITTTIGMTRRTISTLSILFYICKLDFYFFFLCLCTMYEVHNK